MGDGYMVASGVPQPRPDHAAAIARAALSMMDAIEIYNRNHSRDIQLRVGINSGPVIAG
ncbi:MAG: adenylate/guanylate cyclase domain-containing protein [Chloroflexota bacterium]